MWMTLYAAEVQRQLITKYGFRENPDKLGLPVDVPDGEYPMEIEGELVDVRVEGGILRL